MHRLGISMKTVTALLAVAVGFVSAQDCHSQPLREARTPYLISLSVARSSFAHHHDDLFSVSAAVHGWVPHGQVTLRATHFVQDFHLLRTRFPAEKTNGAALLVGPRISLGGFRHSEGRVSLRVSGQAGPSWVWSLRRGAYLGGQGDGRAFEGEYESIRRRTFGMAYEVSLDIGQDGRVCSLSGVINRNGFHSHRGLRFSIAFGGTYR